MWSGNTMGTMVLCAFVVFSSVVLGDSTGYTIQSVDNVVVKRLAAGIRAAFEEEWPENWNSAFFKNSCTRLRCPPSDAYAPMPPIPGVIIPGVMKAGTTDWWTTLSHHPSIVISPTHGFEEVHYFDHCTGAAVGGERLFLKDCKLDRYSHMLMGRAPTLEELKLGRDGGDPLMDAERYRYQQALFDLTEPRQGKIEGCTSSRLWRLPLDVTPSYSVMPLAVEAMAANATEAAILFSMRRSSERWLSHIRNEWTNTKAKHFDLNPWVRKAQNHFETTSKLQNLVQQLKNVESDEKAADLVRDVVREWNVVARSQFSGSSRSGVYENLSEHVTRGLYVPQLLNLVRLVAPPRLLLVSFETYVADRCTIARKVARALCLNGGTDYTDPNEASSAGFEFQSVCGGFHRGALAFSASTHAGTHGKETFGELNSTDAIQDMNALFQPYDDVLPYILAALKLLDATVIV